MYLLVLSKINKCFAKVITLAKQRNSNMKDAAPSPPNMGKSLTNTRFANFLLGALTSAPANRTEEELTEPIATDWYHTYTQNVVVAHVQM
jgi:hypothetical protein